MKSFIRPAAREDILRQYRYYLAEDAPDAANRFLDAVDRAISDLRNMPELGAPKPVKNQLLAGLRSWPVKGFGDMHVYYLIQREILLVVRVLHGRRNVMTLLENEKGDDVRH